jgi:hypothetical protein
MSAHRVVALGIDAPNAEQFERWLAAGELPNIAAIAEQGVTARHSHLKRFRNERCWSIFLSGKDSGATGAHFEPSTYRYGHVSVQREPAPLFYALGDAARVCQFDFPAPISDEVDGVQVTGWGSELNASVQMSDPPGLIEELIERHGSDPKMETGFDVHDPASGEAERSFRNPNLYRPEGLRDYSRFLDIAVERRTEICLDLLGRERWDLFLALFVESHTANHLFWHAGRDYPLASPLDSGEDPLLAVMRKIDEGIGRIAAMLSPETVLAVFTVDDTAQNMMDVPSMALLPELLFRWNFPGQAALAEGRSGEPLPPPSTDFADHWKHEVWRLATEEGQNVLRSPASLEADGEPLNWNPAIWYQDLWPRMRAFALAPVSDGYIRINVTGREAHGIVAPEDYDAVIAELTELLHGQTDPRTGRGVVERIERTREQPMDSPGIPPDLIVCWRSDTPFDAVESPQFGRIGPLPFFRSGGHRAHGARIDNVLFARGPGIAPGSTVKPGHLEDVPATLLALMGAEPRYPIDGRPLFKPGAKVQAA